MSVTVVLLISVAALLAIPVLRQIIDFLRAIRHQVVATTDSPPASTYRPFSEVSSVVRFLRNYWRMKSITKNVPMPTPADPILGHFRHIAASREDVYDKLVGFVKEVGPTFIMWICHVPIFLVTEPDDIEVILSNPKFMNKSLVYHSVEDLIGNGLTTLSDQEYRRHRKAITPSLHLDILQDFVQVFDEEGQRFAAMLSSRADSGEVFDVKPMCGYCANSSVTRTVLSAGVPDDQVNREEFVDKLNDGQEFLMYRIWHPYFLNDWLFSFSTHYGRFQKTLSVLNGFVKTVLSIKVAEHERGERNTSRKHRQAFLDRMLSSKEGSVLSKQELFEEAKTMAIVGSASSMDALAFLCYTLALRPDMQRRMQQEVDDIFGTDDDRPVMPSDLPHLNFTERFIKEVLRYFPVVPIFGRRCPEDIKLPSGYTIPEGCEIGFFLPSTHKNPKYFSEPMKFDPDRWLPEHSKDRHPFSFIPFSAGIRNCIGQRYVMMFMKTILANVVRRITFLPAPNSPTRLEDVPLKMDLTLSVKSTAFVRAERRLQKEINVSAATSPSYLHCRKNVG